MNQNLVNQKNKHMPTGYTQGILNGEIKSFEDFAITCTRAFGATIHMRDEPLSKPWEPEEPSSYHIESKNRLEEELSKYERMTDEEYFALWRVSVKEKIISNEKSLERVRMNRKILDRFREEALSWEPPTDEHVKFKEFMVDQIEKTIEHDGNDSYYIEEIERLKSKLIGGIDPAGKKAEKIDEIKGNIAYHMAKMKDEISRCRQRNSWVESVLNSFLKEQKCEI